MGLWLDAITEADAVGYVMGSLALGRGGTIVTPNLDHLRQFVTSPGVRPLFREADLVVPDGAPLVWASRLAGTPVPARVAGSDLIWSLTAESALHGRSLFLLGGAPGACERAEQALHASYPGVEVSGVHCPPLGFERDPAQMEAIRRKLLRARPDVVFVALGFPKQERLIRQLRKDLPRAWFVGVGISLSFVAGDIARAPDWVQRSGFEWLHRLMAEPRRLWRRYLVHGLPFGLRLTGHSLMARARGGLPTRPAPPARLAIPRASVTFTHGALERRRAADLDFLTQFLS
jgi:N-acetylglucosaminyldiphosphoundecaprenol N-acetyl-beta-D-mannosaminyltransferase